MTGTKYTVSVESPCTCIAIDVFDRDRVGDLFIIRGCHIIIIKFIWRGKGGLVRNKVDIAWTRIRGSIICSRLIVHYSLTHPRRSYD